MKSILSHVTGENKKQRNKKQIRANGNAVRRIPLNNAKRNMNCICSLQIQSFSISVSNKNYDRT